METDRSVSSSKFRVVCQEYGISERLQNFCLKIFVARLEKSGRVRATKKLANSKPGKSSVETDFQ